MKDYETFKPLPVVSASGSYIHLENGKTVIDAISSWWCKSLGHQHPRLKLALQNQMEKFEHVILANTINPTITELSRQLTELSPGLTKVFYASDGSSAVEIAMKMSLHARKIQGDTQRNVFLSLQNSYHGDTIGAMSVSDLGIYRDPYVDLLFQSHFIPPAYVHADTDPLWQDCAVWWQETEKCLEPFRTRATAILVEPIVQGAAGMKLYSQDFLRRLSAWCQQHHVHLIADEIMTGIGRTGKMLACEHAAVQPDFVCLSKGLTSGWLPFSAVLTRECIYDLFYDDYAAGKSFLHSHTYSGNALAASVAIAVLKIMEEENICQRAEAIGTIMRKHMHEIAQQTGMLTHVRGIGAIVAADLVGAEAGQRLGYQVYQAAVQHGALLRPLGNTIYWLPPLNIEKHTLADLAEVTLNALRQVREI